MSANWSSAPLQPLRVSRTSTLLAEYQPCSPADTALGDSILHLHFPIVAEYTLRAAISSAPVARHRVPLEAEYEGEGDRGYDGGGYDDRLRVDGPEQVAAVAVGCRGEGPRQRQRSYWGRERDWRCASLVPHGGERRSGRGGAATEGSGAAGGGGGAEKGSHGMGEELEDVTVTWQR